MSDPTESDPAIPIRLLALAGSFRSGSINQAVLATLRDLMPGGVVIDDIDLWEVADKGEHSAQYARSTGIDCRGP